MLLAAELIHAAHAALKDAEKAFNGIGGHVATGIFARTMKDGFVAGELQTFTVVLSSSDSQLTAHQ